MALEFTKYGWKTETSVKKYYHVKHVEKLMMVDSWVEITERLFSTDTTRKKCGICKLEWQDIPLLENVNIIIFKKQHKNKICCDSCRCNILKYIDN